MWVLFLHFETPSVGTITGSNCKKRLNAIESNALCRYFFCMPKHRKWVQLLAATGPELDQKDSVAEEK